LWPTPASQPADLNDRSRDIAAIGGFDLACSAGPVAAIFLWADAASLPAAAHLMAALFRQRGGRR